jgi:sec-independent protein translocase protein TatA
MGDVAQGIKAFKKGMTDDEAAKAETPAADAKTINHQAEAAKPVEPIKPAATAEKSTT